MPSSDPAGPRLHQHTLLAAAGGAVRVADLLEAGLAGADPPWRVSRGFELDDRAPASASPRDPLAELAQASRQADAVLLHGASDWPAALEAVPVDVGLAVVLHDARPLTGGCPYPLDCPHLPGDCPPQSGCPRGFAPDPAHTARMAELLARPARSGRILVSPSRWLGDLARQVWPLADVRVLPNGVVWPDSAPDRAAARKALGIPERAAVALFAAHGGEQAGYKGGAGWRELWRAVRRQVPGAQALVAGGEPFQDRQSGLTGLGHVAQAAMPGLLATANVLLHPALADNHPLVVLEGLAAATPVLAFRVGGIPEQLAEGGALVAPGDRKAFVAQAAELLARPGRARRLGLAGFAAGQRHFTARAMVRNYANLLRELGDIEAQAS